MHKVLYLGIDPSHFKTEKEIIHMSLIEIIERSVEAKEIKEIFAHVPSYTHIIFASKSQVRLFFKYCKAFGVDKEMLESKFFIAIGHATAYYLRAEGFDVMYVATDETQEKGVIRVLLSLDLEHANILLLRALPLSSTLVHFLVEHDIHYYVCTLYDTHKSSPFTLPDLNKEIDEVVFTHPLAVEQFFALYHDIPDHIKLHPIGIAAREALRKELVSNQRLVIN